jgi:hypothetical protein
VVFGFVVVVVIVVGRHSPSCGCEQLKGLTASA